MLRSSHSPSKDTISIAGWLFADLLLGLSMFFLVSNSVGSQPIPTITSTITPTATSTVTPTPILIDSILNTLTPTTSPTPTSSIGAQGLEMAPVSCEFDVDVPALLATGGPQDSVKDYIKKQLEWCYGTNKDRIAGFVLTMGYHSNILGTGYPMALRVNMIIKEVMPEMFGNVQSEAFGGYRQDKGSGYVWIRAYFVTGLSR